MPTQPNFTVKPDTAAIAGTDFDNMPPEELAKLIRQAHKLKTGREGRLVPSAPPVEVGKYIDYDRLSEERQAKNG